MKELIQKLESIKVWLIDDLPTQSDIQMCKNEINVLIQSLTQEPSVLSEEEVEKKAQFYGNKEINIDLTQRVNKITGFKAGYLQAMQEYATTSMRDNQWVSVNEIEKLPAEEVLCVNKQGYFLVGYLTKSNNKEYECNDDHQMLPYVIKYKHLTL